MFEFSFYAYPWAVITLCCLLYVSDAWLTIHCAKLLDQGADKHYKVHGGYELTPYWQKEVDERQNLLFSPKFQVALGTLIIYLGALAYLKSFAENSSAPYVWIAAEAFEFFSGAWILLQVQIHVRHLSNWFIFNTSIQGIGIRGRLEQSRWYALRLSAFETIVFGLCYLLFWTLLDFRIFLLGGALGCLSSALGQYQMSRKHSPDIVEETQETTNQETLAS